MENHGAVMVWFELVKRSETAGKQVFFQKTRTPPASEAGGVRKESDE
jgi:hypothetical protein